MAVRIPVYQQHVPLDSGSQTIPRIQVADAFGPGLTKAGNSMMAVAEHWKKRQEQFENFKMSQEEARAQQAIASVIQEETQKYDPGNDPPGTLHDRVMARLPGILAPLVANAPERLKPYYQERFATYTDKSSMTAATTESSVAKTYYTGQLDKMAGTLAAGLRNNPEGFKDAAGQIVHSVDGAVNIPSDSRRQMVQAYTKMLAESTVDGFKSQGRFDDAKNFVSGLKDLQDPESQTAPQGDGTQAPTGKNATTAMRFFMDKGLSKQDAAAFVWNFQQESGKGINPTMTHDGGTGYGIAGFRDPSPGNGRRTNLFNFAGTDHPSLEQQLAFSWKELNGPEKGTLDRVLAAQTPEAKAAAAIGYFRPAAQFARDRASRAGEVNSLIARVPDGPGDASATADASPKVRVDPATGKMVMSDAAPAVHKSDASGHIIGGIQTPATSTPAFGVEGDPMSPGANVPLEVAANTTAKKPLTTWGVWADTMNAGIDSAKYNADAKDKTMTSRLKGIVASDLASMSATGQPVMLDTEATKYFGTAQLNHELIAARLGQGAAETWEEDRQTAQRVFGATANMSSMPTSVMMDSLSSLAPVGGEPDFARRQKVYDAAVKQANKIMTLRMADPAAAADEAPEVKALLDKVHKDPTDTQAAKDLTMARIKQQGFLEIPDAVQSPITNSEASQIASPLLDRANPNGAVAAKSVVQGVMAITGGDGDMARKALSKVLEAKGVSQQQAQDTATALAAANRPVSQAITPEDAAAQQRAVEYPGAAAFKKFGPPASTYDTTGPNEPKPDGAFEPGKTMIPAEHIKKLRADDTLRTEFDTTYGNGAAQWVFDNAPGAVIQGNQMVDEAGMSGGADTYAPEPNDNGGDQ